MKSAEKLLGIILENINLKKYELVIKNGSIRVRKKLTMKNAIEEKCAECCGHWADGKKDCRVRECPLYNWCPNAERTPILDWLEYSPRRIGRTKWLEILLSSKEKDNKKSNSS